MEHSCVQYTDQQGEFKTSSSLLKMVFALVLSGILLWVETLYTWVESTTCDGFRMSSGRSAPVRWGAEL